ncbi:MAG: PDZ domain-containing protein [Planctomycetota bacterium]
MFLAPATRVAAVGLSLAAFSFLGLAASGGPETLFPAPPLLAADEPGYLGVTLGDGLAVESVAPGTAAAAAGLLPGDRIAWIADREVKTFEELVAVLAEHPPGSKIGLVYLRGEEAHKCKVTLGSRTAPRLERVPEDAPPAVQGIDRLEIEDALRAAVRGIPGQAVAPGGGFLGVLLGGEGEGVVIQGVVPGSAAEKAGLQEGDRILSLDGLEVKTEDTLRELVAARPAGTRVALAYERNGDQVTVEVALGARSEAQPPGAGSMVLVGPGGGTIFLQPEEEGEAGAGEARPLPDADRRAQIEEVFRELREKSAQQSRRWAGANDERIRELTRGLREQVQGFERTLAELREKAGGEILDEPAHARIRAELEDWARERAQLLEGNARAVRELEASRLERLGRFLDEVRERRGPAAESRLHGARNRLRQVQEGFGELLREEAAPAGRAALEEVRAALGSLRGEMEALRGELETLRRALAERKEGREED